MSCVCGRGWERRTTHRYTSRNIQAYSLEEKLSFSFLSFPSRKIKNQFWILSPKSFKTVDLEDETPKSQGQHAREGICSGQLRKALWCVSAIPAASASDARAMYAWEKGWIHKHFTEPGRGREQLVGKIGSSRATYCLAMLLSALSNWLSQRIGGGEFHKLNPENIEKGGGGENSDSQGMFSSERCFLLLQ